MDPFNMNAMFGPWDEDFEEDEKQRKLRKDYRHIRGQNFRVTAQCNVMIRQIKQMEAENAAWDAQYANDIAINKQMEKMAANANNEFFEIAKKTMEEAAKIQKRINGQNGQTTAEDQQEMDILRRMMEQQEKHMRMSIVLENALTPDTERRQRWERLKEKERKIIEVETEITKKEVILAQILKENGEMKKQKSKRRTWMLKEIEGMDVKIQEQQKLQERREKALKDYDEAQVELRTLKDEKYLDRSMSSESINLDDDLPPPVVFKNPNDFPILRELFQKPKSQKSKREAEKRAKKFEQRQGKSSLKRTKSSANMHSMARQNVLGISRQSTPNAKAETSGDIIDVIMKEQDEKKSQGEVVKEGASTSAASIPEVPKQTKEPEVVKESPPPVPMEIEPSPKEQNEVPQKKTGRKSKSPFPTPSPVKTRSKDKKAKENATKKTPGGSAKAQEKKNRLEEAQKPPEKTVRVEEAQKPPEKTPGGSAKPQEKTVRFEEAPQTSKEKKAAPLNAEKKKSGDDFSFEDSEIDDLFDMSAKLSPTSSDVDLFNSATGSNSFLGGNDDVFNFNDDDPFGSGNNAAGNADSFF